MGVDALRIELLDQALTIPQRFRALFALRSVGGDAAVAALLTGLEDPSALFRHEVAFALGQMQVRGAVAALTRVLRDPAEHSMVRHEAAEALGAIASPECLDALELASRYTCQVVRETAVLALHRLRHAQGAAAVAAATNAAAAAAPPAADQPQSHSLLGSAKERLSAPATATGDVPPAAAAAAAAAAGLDSDSPYLSVDPVPAAAASIPTAELRATLLDEDADMWERYGAMFALRNRGPGPEVAAVLGAVLSTSSSALLKHEVCYVLGQIQEQGGGAREALTATLKNPQEHPMVRHEAAEAIGSIAATDTAPLLRRYAADADSIVAQSCEVALDIMDMEVSNEFIPLALELPHPPPLAAIAV